MNVTDHPIFHALVPVFLLIAVGYLAGRRDWIGAAAVKDLSNLVFLLLTPALLFRTMGQVQIETLDVRPIAAYFSAALLLLLLCIVWRGMHPRSVVLALGGTFSNMVMIGIALVGLAYGKEGLVTLLTLVAVHALILLTLGSVVLELAAARAAQRESGAPPALGATAWTAIKGAIIHPVPLPILAGMLFAQTGWTLPTVVDQPLLWLGNAFGPMALLLVGVSLARVRLAGQWQEALWVVAMKNLALPILVGLSAWAWGLSGLVWTVLVVAAALPMGANVFLFAQRYQVAEDLTTAAMGLSVALALLTLSAAMWVMGWLAA